MWWLWTSSCLEGFGEQLGLRSVLTGLALSPGVHIETAMVTSTISRGVGRV